MPVQPYITGFDRQIDVMASKEKPKKVTMIASDGSRYHFRCKIERKGDLRKDARMMEFNSMVNRLLLADMEGRKRKLRLRTYTVVCLNEECGLMQWVPNTSGFRAEVRAWARHSAGSGRNDVVVLDHAPLCGNPPGHQAV